MEIVNVNRRGALTLPKIIREQGGVPDGGTMRVQITNEGILLTPVAVYPIELYTEERIAEFQRLNEEELKGFRLK